MRKRPKPLLSQPVEEFPDGEWQFLLDEQNKSIIDKEWVEEFLFYELSREIKSKDVPAFCPTIYLKEFSDGMFPETPFYNLPLDVQKTLIEKLRTPGTLFHIHGPKKPAIFQSTISPCLTDVASAHLEDFAVAAAEREARKWDGLSKEDFLPVTNLGEKAASEERNRMIREGDELFEPDLFHLTMFVNLGYPDDAIEKKFSELLEGVRKRRAELELDGRGKVKPPATHCRALAAFRLKRSLGPFESVEAYLLEKKVRNPILTESGWNKAVKRGEEMVEEFKSRFKIQGTQSVRTEDEA